LTNIQDGFYSILFSDASQYLVELASTVPSASLTSWLDQLIDLLTKRNRMFLLFFFIAIDQFILFLYNNLVSSSTVDKTLVTNVVQELRAQLSNDSQFVSSFKVFKQYVFFIPVAKLFSRFLMLFQCQNLYIQDQ